MAKRINLKHTPYDRQRIKVGLLVKLLEDNANGTIELSAGRLKSIEILLKKSMPDLSATEISNVEAPVRYYAELPQKAQSVDAWAEKHGQPDATLRTEDGHDAAALVAGPADQALTKDSTTKH